MSRLKRMSMWISLTALGLMLACATERTTNGPVAGSEGSYIDEPIILAYSGPHAPVEEVENERVFDLSGDSLVQAGLCNDIYIRYTTSSSCEIDGEVWDHVRGEWRQFAYRITESHVCFTSPKEQPHTFSGVGISVDDVLDSAGRVRVRFYGGAHNPRIWTVEVNPDYLMIPASQEAPYARNGLAPGQDFLYSVSFSPFPGIYREDRSEDTEHLFPVDARAPKGLAFDGEHLWLANSYAPGTVTKFSEEGEVLCQFTFPPEYLGGLTWDGSHLWLAEYRGSHHYLYRIDPEASCETGTAAIIDSMPTPGGSCPGLAWDGSHLLVGSDALYMVTREGTITRSYPFPVLWPWDLAWDGARLCLVSYGPTGPTGSPANEKTISCFQLR